MRDTLNLFCSTLLMILAFTPWLWGGERLLFYSQPAKMAEENLKFFQDGIQAPRQMIPLIGSYELIDAASQKRMGGVNIPSVFFEKRPLIFRKSFSRPEDRSLHCFLHFERLNGYVTISINDERIYQDSRNFLPLTLEIPVRILVETNNILEIEVIPWKGQREQLPQWIPINLPRIGNGINGVVFLETTPETYIQEVQIDQPLEETSPMVMGRAVISSTNPPGTGMILECQVITNGLPVYQYQTSLGFDSVNTNQIIPLQIPREYLHRWMPENPVRHQLRFLLLKSGMVVDEYWKSFHVREIYMRQNNLILNNQPVSLKGINYIYQDLQGVPLLDRNLIIQDLQSIRENGFNIIRLAYFPQSPLFYQLTDSLGMLCLQDLPFPFLTETLIGDSIDWSNLLGQIKEFQRLADAHPSLIGIGLGNFYTDLQNVSLVAQQDLRRVGTEDNRYLLYCTAVVPPATSPVVPDLLFLELLERNHPDPWLARWPASLHLNQPVCLSTLSKPFSYRVDSSMITYDLRQLGDLQRKLNQRQEKFAGNFIFTFSDYILETRSLQVGIGKEEEFLMNGGGLFSLDRKMKRDAEIILKERWAFFQGSHSVAEEKGISVYIFIIIGLVNFFLFLFVYRSFVEFRKNIYRALRKPHGFFVELLERRLISYEQSFYLLLVISVNAAVMLSGILYFFRNNLYADYILSLLVRSDGIKMLIATLIWKPYLMIPVLTGVVFLIFVFLALPIQSLSFFRKPRIRFRQAVATSSWSGAPFILLLPFGMFFYNLLLVMNSYWILFVILLYFHVWYFIRWLNGTRVMTLLSYTRVFIYAVVLLIVFGGAAVWYFNRNSDLLFHTDLLIKIFNFYL